MGGSGANILDGGSAGQLLSVRTDSLSISITGMTLQNGAGVFASNLGNDVGGAVVCSADSSLALDDVIITTSSASLGGGIFLDGCTISGQDVEISSNQATFGGGVFAYSGALSLTDSLVTENFADYSGGGIALEGASNDVALDLTDSLITDNEGYYGGGLSILFAADVTCTGSSAVRAGITNNTNTSGSDYGGGVYIQYSDYTGYSFVGVDCDMGTVAGKDDNDPSDIYHAEQSISYDVEDDASFTCDSDECC